MKDHSIDDEKFAILSLAFICLQFKEKETERSSAACNPNTGKTGTGRQLKASLCYKMQSLSLRLNGGGGMGNNIVSC